MKTADQAATSLFNQIEERYSVVDDDGNHGVDFVGLSSGFSKLDTALGGFRAGGLYIVGGRTGIGKSAFALNVTENISNLKKVSYYLSLEMSAELLVLRLFAGLSLVDARKIELGRLSTEEYTRVKRAREQVSELKLVIDDDRISSVQLADRLEKVGEKYGRLDFAAVDYLSLFTELGDSEVQRLENITGRVSEAASRFNIPLMGLVQLNRATTQQEDALPTLANIRYSDRISHDAFAVILVHRPAYYAKMQTVKDVEEDALIRIDKNRMGPKGDILANYYPRQMRWEVREEKPTEPAALSASAKIKQERMK